MLIDPFNKTLMEIQKRDTALQQSEEQFKMLADSVPQLPWMAEPDGHIFWYNQRWYDYTGTTPEQMKGWGTAIGSRSNHQEHAGLLSR